MDSKAAVQSRRLPSLSGRLNVCSGVQSCPGMPANRKSHLAAAVDIINKQDYGNRQDRKARYAHAGLQRWTITSMLSESTKSAM